MISQYVHLKDIGTFLRCLCECLSYLYVIIRKIYQGRTKIQNDGI